MDWLKVRALLTGTTSIVSVGTLLATTPSVAEEKIKIGIGGYFQAFAVYVDQSDGPGEPGENLRKHTIAREAEIIFSGETKLDNGIKIGAQVQLEAETCSDQIDESFIWFSGNFGRINIGSENSAPYLMHYATPKATFWSHGLNSPSFQHPEPGSNITFLYPHTHPVDLSADAEKITYFSPRFKGFQFGLSYTPDVCEENAPVSGGIPACGGSYSGNEPDNTSFGEVWEIGANYVDFIGDVSVAISGSYGEADLEPGGAGRENSKLWSAGINLGYEGITIGGGYKEQEGIFGFTGIESIDYNAGIRYQVGRVAYGFEYAYKETASPFQVGPDSLDAFEVGISYVYGPGLVLSAGLQYWDVADNANAANAENEAYVAFFGTHVSF